jgi:hypothetical protein
VSSDRQLRRTQRRAGQTNAAAKPVRDTVRAQHRHRVSDRAFRHIRQGRVDRLVIQQGGVTLEQHPEHDALRNLKISHRTHVRTGVKG